MTVAFWLGFVAIVTVLVFIDLRVTGRAGHVLTAGESLAWTGLYVFLAMAFNVLVFFIYENHWLGMGLDDPTLTGRVAAAQFFTAWLLEKSLSLDNIFVIALIFSYFRVAIEHQHKVLFWGVLGAIVLRALLILAGSELLHRFEWTSYLFGAVLIATAVRMLVVRHETLDPEKSPLVRLAKRFYPVSSEMHGSRFFVMEHGKRAMTPLFLALLMVEGFDVVFAIDSIPAALAVTSEPFLVFTSNVFAVLGLRALYFVLANYLDRLRHLKTSLVFLLSYVGVKMMLVPVYRIPTLVSLSIILGILGVGVLASLVSVDRDPVQLRSPIEHGLEDLRRIRVRWGWCVALAVISSTVVVLALGLVVAPDEGPLHYAGAGAILLAEVVWAAGWLSRVHAARREE